MCLSCTSHGNLKTSLILTHDTRDCGVQVRDVVKEGYILSICITCIIAFHNDGYVVLRFTHSRNPICLSPSYAVEFPIAQIAKSVKKEFFKVSTINSLGRIYHFVTI